MKNTPNPISVYTGIFFIPFLAFPVFRTPPNSALDAVVIITFITEIAKISVIDICGRVNPENSPSEPEGKLLADVDPEVVVPTWSSIPIRNEDTP